MTGFLTPYLVLDETATTPEWTQKMIWYRLMPDRFANGDQKKDLKDTLEWGQEADKAKFFGGLHPPLMDRFDQFFKLLFGPKGWIDLIVIDRIKFMVRISIKNCYSERLTYEALNNNPHMPKVDLENPEVQAYFGNILTYWTRNFDFKSFFSTIENTW